MYHIMKTERHDSRHNTKTLISFTIRLLSLWGTAPGMGVWLSPNVGFGTNQKNRALSNESYEVSVRMWRFLFLNPMSEAAMQRKAWERASASREPPPATLTVLGTGQRAGIKQFGGAIKRFYVPGNSLLHRSLHFQHPRSFL
jgi:hypothetical protein